MFISDPEARGEGDKGPCHWGDWGLHQAAPTPCPLRIHLPTGPHPALDLHLGGRHGSARLSITEGPGSRQVSSCSLRPEAAGKTPGGRSMQDSGRSRAACVGPSLAPEPWFPPCLKAGEAEAEQVL